MILTRRQCLNSALNLAEGDEISRRNALRSLADFNRVLLREIGSHHTGYGMLKDLSIFNRYRLLSTAVSELLPYEGLFKKIQGLRNDIDHDDDVIPSITSIMELIKESESLNTIVDNNILPNIRKLETSPLDKLSEVWNGVLYLYDRLDNYLFVGWDRQEFEAVVKRVREYYPRVPGFKDLDTNAIINTTMDLVSLEQQIKGVIRQVKRPKNQQ